MAVVNPHAAIKMDRVILVLNLFIYLICINGVLKETQNRQQFAVRASDVRSER